MRALFALLVLTALAYQGVASTGFVWDDIPLVVRNELTGDLGNWPRFFVMDLWAASPVGDLDSGYYRPLMLFSLAVDRAFYGLDPGGAHLHSLAWHLLAVVAIHRLGVRLLGARGGLVAATLFALHPLQSEAVVWIAGRNDLMATALGVFALDQVVGREGGRGVALRAFALTLLAGFSKESVVLLPAMLVAADLLMGGRSRLLRGFSTRHLPIWGAIGLVFGLRMAAGVAAAPPPTAAGWALVQSAFPWLIGEMGSLVLWPHPLVAGRALEWWASHMDPLTWLGGVVLLVASLGMLRSRTEPLTRVGWTWAALALAVVLVPLAAKGTVGERYLYFPMVGLSLAVGSALRGLSPRILLALAAPLALVWGLVIHQRLPDWESNLTLWKAAVQDAPDAYAHTSLGHAHREQDAPLKALEQFRLGVAVDPPDQRACRPLLGTALGLGRPDLAVQLGEWALKRGCGGVPEFGGHFGSALVHMEMWERAAEVVAGAPDDPSGRLDVVGGAMARRAGDDAAYLVHRAKWSDGGRFDEEVDQLLR